MHAPKWRTGAGVLTLLAWLTSCGPNNKAVEYPLIETANTNALDIAKVELTDSATILHTDAYYRPHNWIRISSESYLQAGGKRYMLTGAEGITPDSLFWMPESGEASFTLCFEPLPSGTTSFDFIESDCEDCFKLFGIDLTGKKHSTYRITYPKACGWSTGMRKCPNRFSKRAPRPSTSISCIIVRN